MTRRAAITQADIARATRVALEHGMEVEVWPMTGLIRLVGRTEKPADAAPVDGETEIRL